jgi:hypothetical protein
MRRARWLVHCCGPFTAPPRPRRSGCAWARWRAPATSSSSASSELCTPACLPACVPACLRPRLRTAQRPHSLVAPVCAKNGAVERQHSQGLAAPLRSAEAARRGEWRHVRRPNRAALPAGCRSPHAARIAASPVLPCARRRLHPGGRRGLRARLPARHGAKGGRSHAPWRARVVPEPALLAGRASVPLRRWCARRF